MIARFCHWLAHSPRLVAWLIAIAQRTPYTHIHGPDGSLFIGRWWLVKERTWLPFAIRIHHIVRADADRHLHDHPWDWRTVVLMGGYVEEDIYGRLTIRREGSTHARRAEEFHRVAKVLSGGAWTLFITGRERQEWGFLAGGHKVGRRLYSAFASKWNRTAFAIRLPVRDSMAGAMPHEESA